MSCDFIDMFYLLSEPDSTAPMISKDCSPLLQFRTNSRSIFQTGILSLLLSCKPITKIGPKLVTMLYSRPIDNIDMWITTSICQLHSFMQLYLPEKTSAWMFFGKLGSTGKKGKLLGGEGGNQYFGQSLVRGCMKSTDIFAWTEIG